MRMQSFALVHNYCLKTEYEVYWQFTVYVYTGTGLIYTVTSLTQYSRLDCRRRLPDDGQMADVRGQVSFGRVQDLQISLHVHHLHLHHS